jgi:hypothetical protein
MDKSLAIKESPLEGELKQNILNILQGEIVSVEEDRSIKPGALCLSISAKCKIQSSLQFSDNLLDKVNMLMTINNFKLEYIDQKIIPNKGCVPTGLTYSFNACLRSGFSICDFTCTIKIKFA